MKLDSKFLAWLPTVRTTINEALKNCYQNKNQDLNIIKGLFNAYNGDKGQIEEMLKNFNSVNKNMLSVLNGTMVLLKCTCVVGTR